MFLELTAGIGNDNRVCCLPLQERLKHGGGGGIVAYVGDEEVSDRGLLICLLFSAHICNPKESPRLQRCAEILKSGLSSSKISSMQTDLFYTWGAFCDLSTFVSRSFLRSLALPI